MKSPILLIALLILLGPLSGQVKKEMPIKTLPDNYAQSLPPEDPPSQTETEIIEVSEDLTLHQLSKKVWIHISWFETNTWGRIPSNGLIYVQEGEAFLFDTPMSDSVSIQLINHLQNEMDLKIVGFVPNHFHDDCLAGIEQLHDAGVQTYSHEMTRDLSAEHGEPTTHLFFKDSVDIRFHENIIRCDYLGPGHSKDNIVVWLPEEKILFAGCMCKSMASKGLGNTADADLEQWPITLGKVLEKYHNAKVVIPGHGSHGGTELLEHSIELLENNK